MAEFRFEPRALLELGRELISSDEVAIYELIKNGVDARSAVIEVEAHVTLPHSGFARAEEMIRSGADAETVLIAIEKSLYTLAPEGARSQLLDELRACWKAEPKALLDGLKEIYGKHNWIEVRDKGHGMSLQDLDRVFLTIGTRSRRAENVSGGNYLGDKGVGRLSTMRLGDYLQVRTTTTESSRWHLLDIDWSLFSHDTNVALSDIVIEPKNGSTKGKPSDHGTAIRISHLNADWSLARFRDMFAGQIARMIDPFVPGKANELLLVRWHEVRVLVPSIPQTLLKNAHAICHVEFEFDKKGLPALKGKIDYQLKHKVWPVSIVGSDIYSIAQRDLKNRGKKGHAASELVPISPVALRDLGPFSVDIYWFNRRVVDAISGLSDKAAQTKAFIQEWAGGPMLYRRGFRILPYGDPENDWLQLDKKAFGAPGFKLNRQQLIGRVVVNATHMALSEQTNREGLIGSDASEALTVIMKWLVHVEMRGFINRIDALDTLQAREPQSATEEIRAAEDKVDDALQALRRAVGPDHVRRIEHLRSTVADLVKACDALVDRHDKDVKDAAFDRDKFIHLAGIGLITEFIFHELDRAVNHTLKLLPEARGARRDDALRNLEDQLKTLQKRVSAFDELSGEKRQSKTTFDLGDLVENVLANHANQFERHHIEVSFDKPDEPYRVRAVRGMVIQILENLIVNAVYWLKVQARHQSAFRPNIEIGLDEGEHTLTIEDNGGGIDPSRREHIFEPFVSSKPASDGGRGLGLYIARELAEYNGWELYLDDEQGRTREGRLSLFVLDMDETNG